MPIIVKENDFNVDNVTFSPPKKSKKDNKLRSYLLYNGQQAEFESPWLRLPWDISAPYQDPDSKTKAWSISFQEQSCQDFDTDEEKNEQKEMVAKWFESWRALYDKFIDFCIEYSSEIFGKKYTKSQREVVMALVAPFVKTTEDYPSQLRSKVYNSNGVPDTKVYRGSNAALKLPDFNALKELAGKGSFIKQILVPNIWFINKGAGISISSKQILLQETDSGKSSGFAFNVKFKENVKEITDDVEKLDVNLDLDNEDDSSSDEIDDDDEEEVV
tara:strand:- start:64 stop:882 length:819 start_codon:yes stop_codon:yes gene_type:complete